MIFNGYFIYIIYPAVFFKLYIIANSRKWRYFTKSLIAGARASIKLTAPLTFRKYSDFLRLVVYEEQYKYSLPFPLQQLKAWVIGHCWVVQYRVVLQMNKAASVHKDILRNHKKYHVHRDIDSYLWLFSACYCEKTLYVESQHSIFRFYFKSSLKETI